MHVRGKNMLPYYIYQYFVGNTPRMFHRLQNSIYIQISLTHHHSHEFCFFYHSEKNRYEDIRYDKICNKKICIADDANVVTFDLHIKINRCHLLQVVRL